MRTATTRRYRDSPGGRIVDVMTTESTVAPDRRTSHALRARVPGIAVTTTAVAISLAATAVLPAVSALTVAVVLGIIANNIPRVLPGTARPGLVWITRRLLRAGVVLLGLQLAVPQLLALGGGTLLAVLVTVLITFSGTLLLGRLLGLPRGLSLLVGTGFSICGASAVAAMEGVAEDEESDVATAVALVTVFGSLSMFVLPLISGPLGLHGVDAGRWAGASVHEVAQVVAAASPAGAAAVATAIVVKLSRVALLAPLVAGVSLVTRRRSGGAGAVGPRPPLIPLFVLGFLGMVALRSVQVLPGWLVDGSKSVTTVLLAGALFGLGTTVDIRALVTTGPRALLLGLCSTLLVSTTAFLALTAFA